MQIDVLGYSPTNAVERKIKDGAKYDRYIAPAQQTRTVAYKDGNVEDTIRQMNLIVEEYSWQVRNLAPMLERDTFTDTCRSVWQFIVDYLKYDRESGEELRTPARAWFDAQIMARQEPTNPKFSCDCDCMSIFAASLLKELNFDYQFKIASYNSFGTFQHVYVIASDNRKRNLEGEGESHIIDAVLPLFDTEKQSTLERVYTADFRGLSGNDIEPLPFMFEGLAGKKKGKNVKFGDREKRLLHIANAVPMLVPRQGFRALVALNFFGIATILEPGVISENEAKAKGYTTAEIAKVKEFLERFKNFWYNMGGKEDKIVKALKNGAKRKPKFNKKAKNIQNLHTANITDTDVDDETIDIDDEVSGLAALDGIGLAAAISSGGAFLAKVWDALKKAGILDFAKKHLEDRGAKEDNKPTPVVDEYSTEITDDMDNIISPPPNQKPYKPNFNNENNNNNVIAPLPPNDNSIAPVPVPVKKHFFSETKNVVGIGSLLVIGAIFLFVQNKKTQPQPSDDTTMQGVAEVIYL